MSTGILVFLVVLAAFGMMIFQAGSTAPTRDKLIGVVLAVALVVGSWLLVAWLVGFLWRGLA